MKKIMLLEPNPYHSEVLPGIVKYLEDLNYIVDVYIRNEAIEKNVFCRYKIKGNITGYFLSEVKDLFSSEQMQEYDFLFLSSMEHSENGTVLRFLDEIGIIPQTKYGVIGMYHTNWLINTFNDHKMQEEDRLFMISDFQTKEYFGVHTLSPVFWGNVRLKCRKRVEKIRLLVVGASMDIFMLQEAYWKLLPNERKKIEIRFIGQEQNKCNIKDVLYNFFMFLRGIFVPRFRRCRNLMTLGKVNYDQMYSEVEQADFMLVLLDPFKEYQQHYTCSSTSGVRQLILGFSKIGIMHHNVAEKYGFPEEACIRFESGKLETALKKAIYMQQDDYRHMVSLVKGCRNKLFSQEKKNLANIIESIERDSYEHLESKG